MISYIIIYKPQHKMVIYESQYITFKKALSILENKKAYIFKYNNNNHILYLNYPLERYYDNTKINTIDDNNTEEDVESFEYIEVRLTEHYPCLRVGINVGDL